MGKQMIERERELEVWQSWTESNQMAYFVYILVFSHIQMNGGQMNSIFFYVNKL